MVLFIYYVVLTFESVNKSYGVNILKKPLQQYVYMVLFTYYVVLTFESMNKSSSAVLYIVVLYLVCSSNF